MKNLTNVTNLPKLELHMVWVVRDISLLESQLPMLKREIGALPVVCFRSRPFVGYSTS